MGCFTVFPCFTSSKHPKLNKSVNQTTEEESLNTGSLKPLVLKSRVDSEDQVINEDVEGITDILFLKSEDGKEKNVEWSGKLGVLVQRESANERDDETKNGNGKLGVLVRIETENERKEERRNSLGVHVDIEIGSDDESDVVKEVRTETHKKEIQSGAVSDCSVSSYISYPPMHRYHNFVTDDDEEHLLVHEDSPESFFSLSIDPTRHSQSSSVAADDKEVSSIENNHNERIDSLLYPIENLAQRKTTKARPMHGLDHLQEKENVYIEHEEISKVSDRKGKVKTNTVVTTSLSSWLVDPKKSTASKEESETSWKSCEDRPILGACSIDEVKQISARSSPRKSPRHNPDDTPIIGTVGSYWSHTGQAKVYKLMS
ncbi:putative protein JASON [Helianthus anomalus]